MPRATALAARAVLQDTDSAVALLAFLTLTHPNLSQPVRLVSDVMDYVWQGNLFTGVPFGFELLTDGDAPPETQLVLPNLDRRIGQALRKVTGRAQVALQVLASTDFDLTTEPREEIGTPAPVYGFAHFEVGDVEVNAVQVTARVMLRDFAAMPFGLSATQARCPGLFR